MRLRMTETEFRGLSIDWKAADSTVPPRCERSAISQTAICMAFEEFDLGARLQARGWKLARIDQRAVDHYGYTIGGYQLLWRRLKSGYAAGLGEVLRGALGKKHFWFVLRKLRHLRYGAAVILGGYCSRRAF